MHEQFLLAALEQAQLGRGYCAPNPCVGAVAVQNKKIIAQAFHQGAGTPHAEQLLLAQLTPKMPGVSLYITLEPCNHWGRTPPCVDLIIEYGIEEVIFAYYDPNPVVAKNDSTQRLRNKNIKVTQVSIPEINQFYESYNYWTTTQRPRVTAKIAQTLDGYIAGPAGERLFLSNDLCAEFTHQMRSQSDVILTSAKTILKDNPLLNVRRAGNEQSKVVAIIDSHLVLNAHLNVFSKASHCHIYHQEGNSAQYPNSSYHPMPAINDGMDLTEIIKHLGKLGYHDVWVEAGSALFNALHQQGLVQRTYLYIVPTVLGQKGVQAYQQNNIFVRDHTLSWLEKGDNMIACVDWKGEMCLLES